MRNFFCSLTKWQLFFASLIFQCIIFVPIAFAFAFWEQGPRYTYASLASVSLLIAWPITLIAICFMFKVTSKKRLSYALPFSFAVFPLCLNIITAFISQIRTYELLPYEWGSKYPRMVTEMYSIPFIVLTVILISSFKLSVLISKKKAEANKDKNL